MKPLAAMLALMTGSGCIYLDQINQRPSVSIHQLTEGTPLRGDPVQLEAQVDDPDGDEVVLHWRVYACTGGVDPMPDCDAAPYDESSDTDYTVMVPRTRQDGTPVRALRILLDAHDVVGAVAKPVQELVVAIGDEDPLLQLRQDTRHNNVIDSHISLFADLADPDDGPDGVTLQWDVFTPPNVQPTFDLLDAPPPTTEVVGHRGEAKTFVPHGEDAVGPWDVRVTATDPLGAQIVEHFMINVTDDQAPCIASSSPLAATGQTLPLIDVTRFEIPVVTDDLDVYPPLFDDIDAGAAGFRWTLQTNGGTREPLAITGDSVLLDPASFQSGDVLELRAEITDRQVRDASFASCGDAATCSFNANSCTQRQTWRVEVP